MLQSGDMGFPFPNMEIEVVLTIAGGGPDVTRDGERRQDHQASCCFHGSMFSELPAGPKGHFFESVKSQPDCTGPMPSRVRRGPARAGPR